MIFTRHKAKWDSQKEYDLFWHPEKRKYDTYNRKPKKRKKKPFLLMVFLLCIVLFSVIKFSGNDWETVGGDKTVGSQSIVDSSSEDIPEFAGENYIVLNNNQPQFNETDFANISGESYSDLDKLDRCGTAVAMLHRSMMPTEERGEIGQIKPSGWHQEKYEGYVDSNPPYLYNRCHLIAYALTGQNANVKNLITGTRYMNATTMLAFEKEVMEYLDNSDNHVLYRVTPYFKNDELLARGVEMEAYSVEDNGEGVCFHVFVYNVQPGIDIDYRTGESKVE